VDAPPPITPGLRVGPAVVRRWTREHPDAWLNAIGALIGVATALGAVAFDAGLTWAEHTSEHFQHVLQVEGRGVWVLPVIPMIGALITGLLVYFFARDAAGHGVPQVLDAIVRRGGEIRAKTGMVKVLASIATVGSGGSGGAEGPIIQIGSVIGSVIARTLGIPRAQVPTLVGCGAAAGIASIFNAPIAGVFFAVEILLRDFSLRVFTPIVIASVFATALAQVILAENEAIFAVELPRYIFTPAELPAFIVLGLLCAIGSWVFTAVLHRGEHLAERHLRVHPIFRPMAGAFLLGLLGIAGLMLFRSVGDGTAASGDGPTPSFFGNGYAMIRGLLEPTAYAVGATWTAAGLLVVLSLFKVFATTLTLGTGGSGGVFAPSLFVGATIGGGFGVALQAAGLLPGSASPAQYALVGMAALVAGTTFAPMTAILLLFEITREPKVLAPIMLAAIVSTMLARKLMKDSIYTAELRRQGVRIGTSRDLSVLRHVHVSSVTPTPLPREAVYASDPLSKLITLHAYHNVPDFPVVDAEGKYIGMVTGADMRTALIDREAIPLLLVAELMRSDLPTIRADETLDAALEKFASHDVSSLCLVDAFEGAKPIALITRSKVMARYHAALDEE
jgi:CIC family chloride channel protein